MQKQIITARSPAKLILSGEHSVLYGAPAIAFAINKHVYTTIIQDQSHASVLFNLLNFKNAKKFTEKTLKELKERLQENYQNYQNGQCSIKDVLQTPFDLVNFTLTNLIEAFNVNLSQGFSVKTESNIPIGCGMGSSAATIMSLLHALGRLLNLDLSSSKYMQLAKDAENLQHGKSSGVDLYLSMTGGACLYKNNFEINIRKLNQKQFYLVNTGEPLSTTGDAVSSVKKYFEKSNLVNDFTEVTNSLDKSFSDEKFDEKNIINLIKENHKLLNSIKVVPEKVNSFIKDLERENCAAKTCGAGAIRGDKAGAVLIFADDIIRATKIINKYNYQLEIVEIDDNGSQILPQSLSLSNHFEFSEVVSY